MGAFMRVITHNQHERQATSGAVSRVFRERVSSHETDMDTNPSNVPPTRPTVRGSQFAAFTPEGEHLRPQVEPRARPPSSSVTADPLATRNPQNEIPQGPVGGSGTHAGVQMDSFRGELRSALADSPLQAAVVEQMLNIADRVKGDILHDIRQEHGALQRKLEEKIAVLSAVMQQVHLCVLRGAIDSRSREVEGLSKKRKGPEPPSLMHHVDIFTNGDQGLEQHLSFLFLLTVVSFARNHQHFMAWIDPTSSIMMSRHYGVFQATSGLSVLFFGCLKSLGKYKFQTAVARAWSVALRWVIMKKVALTKKYIAHESVSLGGNPTETTPLWLSSFGDAAATYGFIDRVVAVEENTDEMSPDSIVGSTASSGSRDRSSKRRRDTVREEKRRKVGLTGSHSPILEARVFAVQTARSKFMHKLTTCRNDARKILFQDLFFVVEKIASYGSPELAQEDGFDIVFNSTGAPSLLNMISVSPTGMWKIPLAKLVSRNGTEEEAKRCREDNMQAFVDMQAEFPFLTVELKYKVVAVNPGTNEKHYAARTKQICLHKVIGDVLLAAYKLPEFESILSSSALSLRAIHLQAVGLYAVLRKLCGYSLCSVETALMGHVTWKVLKRVSESSPSGRASASQSNRNVLEEGSLVTAMYGGGADLEMNNEEKPTLLQKYRDELLSMPWEEYEAMDVDAAMTAQSDVPAPAPQFVGITEELLENWPANSGAPS